MGHSGSFLLAVVLIGLALPSAAGAICAPEKLMRIVTHDVTPSVALESFLRKPKTLYRMGTKYGRVEEPSNPRTGIHLLVVVNEPDVWMVNLRDRTGRHIVDPGPTFNFRAPVFEKEGMPPLLETLELGCERAFLKANGAKLGSSDTVRGRRCALHSVELGDFRVALCLDTATEKPMRASVYERNLLLFAMEYDTYQDDLAPDPTLFAQPRGITFPGMARVSKQVAITAALGAVREYDPKIQPLELVATADPSNAAWKNFLTSDPSFLNRHPVIQQAIQGRDYWAVHVRLKDLPNTMTFGGEFFVFIDPQNGNVIQFVPFK
jgi:hypothetical protein